MGIIILILSYYPLSIWEILYILGCIISRVHIAEKISAKYDSAKQYFAGNRNTHKGFCHFEVVKNIAGIEQKNFERFQNTTNLVRSFFWNFFNKNINIQGRKIHVQGRTIILDRKIHHVELHEYLWKFLKIYGNFMNFHTFSYPKKVFGTLYNNFL